MKENVPKYFLHKLMYAQPHQFMQVNHYVLMRTQENVLYRLPCGTEVYGDDEDILITDYDSKYEEWMPHMYNPKTKGWVQCKAKEEKDWLFSRSNLEYDLRNKEYEKICFDSTEGYIEFDVIKWLQNTISPTITADEDFYYYGVVKVGEKEYNLERCFDENGSVKSSNCLKIICNREGNVYNIQEELKRYFSNKKLPIDTKRVFEDIKGGNMTLEEFELWVRN